MFFVSKCLNRNYLYVIVFFYQALNNFQFKSFNYVYDSCIFSQDVIQRVQDLQAEGCLTGVIDDRGKFIYITVEELEAVARYIRQNGRVSISDLAASSNRLISLEPDTSTLAAKMAAEVAQMVEVEEAAA